MREFFKGWRRKTGTLTLVMALVAMGGWVRSLYVEDSLGFPTFGSQSVWLLNVNGFVGFTIIPDRHYFWYSGSLTHDRFDNEFYLVSASGVRLGGRWKDGTIDEIDPNPRNPIQPKFVPPLISHWPLIVMLALLSALLLLSTHRLFITVERIVAQVAYKYFAKYRQPTGVFAAILVVLLTSWWIKSSIVNDRICFKDFVGADFAKRLVYPISNRCIVGLATNKHSLVWLTYDNHNEILPALLSFPTEVQFSRKSKSDVADYDRPLIALPPLSTVAAPIEVSIVPHVATPFWSLILPLTAVSAYLLRSKPRDSTEKKNTEPVPAVGT